MGLAEDMNRALHKELNCHLAWLPISNTFALGDYGVFSRGIFTKMGSVADFGLGFDQATGPDVKLDFASKETAVVNLLGEVAVDVFPQGALNAKIKISFKKESSFLLKAAKVAVSEIQNLQQLMDQLKARPDWRRANKIVAKVWRAQDAALLAASNADTEVTLSGDVPRLQQFQLGKASAELRVGKNKELGAELVGKSGIVGLGLVQRGIFGDVGYLGDADTPATIVQVPSTGEMPNDDYI